MANSFHLSQKVVSRSDGHSAVAASAYIARQKMENERTGDVHNYSKGHNDVLWHGVFTPKGSPEALRDPANLWNEIEKVEKHPRAQLCKTIVCALPHELTTEQQTYILKDFVREQYTRKGYAAQVALHRPDRRGDQRNVHAHIQVTMRTVDAAGKWSNKDRTFSEKGAPPKDELLELRAALSKRINAELVKHGHEPRFDHRTLAEQGSTATPTTHVGKDATNLDRDTQQGERAEAKRLIEEANRLRAEAAKIEREHANENARKVAEHANDDRPQVEQKKPTAAQQQEAAAQVAVVQSAVDRMRAEERAEHLATLRSIGRAAWQSMGDELRGILSAVKSLATTMGSGITNIILGADAYLWRRNTTGTGSDTGKMEGGKKPVAPIQTAETIKRPEAPAPVPTITPTATTGQTQPQQPGMLEQLERMAAERKTAHDKARAERELRELVKSDDDKRKTLREEPRPRRRNRDIDLDH